MKLNSEFYERFFASAAEPLFVLDPDFRVVAANEAYLRRLNLRLENALGREIFQLFASSNAEWTIALRHSLDRVLAGVAADSMLPFNEQQIWPGGSESNYFRAENVRYSDSDGRLESIAHRLTDVSELMRVAKRLSVQDEANRLKDEFFAILSHELRTPLNAVLGWAQLLLEDSSNPAEVAKGLEVIRRNCRSQSQMIADLLDMSAVIGGKVRLKLQPVEVGPAVDAALETVADAAAKKEITLTSRCAQQSLFVCADADRLQQILWNLLNNAIKFTPPQGSIEVITQQNGARIEIFVRDTGRGIEPEFLPKIFEKFRQGESSPRRRYRGLGLGLAIVKQLAELQNGEVKATSAGLGKGSTFLLSLPVSEEKRCELPQTAADAAALLNALPSLDGVKVLVVDDEKDARELIKQILERSNSEVRTAASVSEAVELFGDCAPDVLLSDIAMPNEDGYALIKKVREGVFPGNSVPAIALTAFAAPEDRTRALDAGFQLHLAKPFDPAELIAAIANLSRHARNN